MIGVTGATGNLGSAVVENLLRHIPASQIAACVREPTKARSLAERGVTVRPGDYDRPEDLVHSFARVERLLLISASGIDHEQRAARHGNAIEAAAQARVGHVYYTSLLPGDDSVAYVMKAHLDTERDLKASGLPFTILKNGVYSEAWGLYLGEKGEVAVPADGPVSWVSRADLAEGMVRLLLDGKHRGETLNLTGPAALNMKAVAAMQGRTVRIVSVEEYIARQKAAGQDADHARKWATTYFGMARGEFAKVDPYLGKLVGRPLRTMEQVVAK